MTNDALLQRGVEVIRHEGFLQGFVAARDPKNPLDTLRTLEEAERAWLIFVETTKERTK
jgi:hypothetical protein